VGEKQEVVVKVGGESEVAVKVDDFPWHLKLSVDTDFASDRQCQVAIWTLQKL
jgi:hypothetical protein